MFMFMGSLFLATSFTACKWELRCKDFRLESEIRKPTQSISHGFSICNSIKTPLLLNFLAVPSLYVDLNLKPTNFSRLWIHCLELNARRALKNIKNPHDLRSIAVLWIYSVWGFMFIGFLLLPFSVCNREEVRREVRSEDLSLTLIAEYILNLVQLVDSVHFLPDMEALLRLRLHLRRRLLLTHHLPLEKHLGAARRHRLQHVALLRQFKHSHHLASLFGPWYVEFALHRFFSV